jgi:uncharacterized protein YgbK (DUF1537 family)
MLQSVTLEGVQQGIQGVRQALAKARNQGIEVLFGALAAPGANW